MIELEFLDTHPDETRLILTDSDGQRYSLPITDSLREAMRPVRPNLSAVASPSHTPSPRDIQTFIRQGATVEQIAAEFSLPPDSIRKLERPILDERRYIAQMAQSATIDSATDAPQLRDLVVDRLAARGIDPDTITWDAVRSGKEPWEIIVRFVQSAVEKEAHWSFEQRAKRLAALDREAVSLTETTVPPPSDPFGIAKPLPWEAGGTRDSHTDPSSPLTRHASVSGIFGESSTKPNKEDKQDHEAAIAHMPGVGAQELLDELNSARGVRQSIDMSEFEDDDEQTIQIDVSDDDAEARVVQLHGKDTSDTLTDGNVDEAPDNARSADDEALDPATQATKEASDEDYDPHEDSSGAPQTEVLPGLERFDDAKTPSRKARRAKKRRSVPSWDEIVFGARAKDDELN